MPSGNHDSRKPMRGACETPQRIKVVMMAKAKGEVEDEGTAE